jgi:ABC-type antimicrobial peptide transport system permease subunit
MVSSSRVGEAVYGADRRDKHGDGLHRDRRGERRMALGANPSHVLAQVMKHGVLLTSVGVAAGVAGALGLNRLMASLLFGVQPTDAGTLAAVILTISLVAVVACWLPAWRASRLDPNLVLRED